MPPTDSDFHMQLKTVHELVDGAAPRTLRKIAGILLQMPTPPRPRLFQLVRHEDETGVSGTGVVAEGVQFTNGVCALTWLTEYTSTAIYNSLAELEHIHGHQGKTEIRYI